MSEKIPWFGVTKDEGETFHEWEEVHPGDKKHLAMHRLKVPGGWIYLYGAFKTPVITFVPGS